MSDFANHQAPYLKSSDKNAFRPFVEQFRIYKAQGGKISINKLISVDVCRRLELMFPDLKLHESEDDSIITVLLQINAPKSKLEALDRFQSIRMENPKGDSEDPLIDYILAFKDLQESFPKEYLPSDGRLTEVYIYGLKPKHLRDSVYAMEPETIEQAVSSSREEFEKLLALSRWYGHSAFGLLDQQRHKSKAYLEPGQRNQRPNNTSGTNNNHTSNGNRTWNSTTGSSAVLPEQTNTRNTNTFVKQRNDVICHRCGVAGHISPNCPLKRDDNNWSIGDSGRLACNASTTFPPSPCSHALL